VRTISFQFITLTVGFCLLGCSGTDTSGPPPGGGGDQSVGGSTDVGGNSSAAGGSRAAGGATQVGGGANTGGRATGGVTAVAGGNNPGTGGATGGSPQTGGSKAVGGAPATGGMAPTAGGTPATGGSKATGGMTPTTGGSKATGGMAPTTGGMPATGGSKATGGMAPSTGGTPPTGGSKATGGMAPTGGAKATGGTPATGGTTSTVTTKKFFGNITTGNSVNPSGLNYSHYWDQITPENAGKWGSVQSSPTSAFNWGTLDAIYNYTNTNNIIFKQHCFVWGSQQPSGTPTLAQVENWIKSFCARYPNTKLIDVVNEPPTHTTPNYTANLGAGEGGTYPWITKAFKLARQYCGSAILILNDYNTIEYSGDETRFINIVKDIKANGAPIDAVGAQAHAAHSFSAATIQTNLNTLASQTGLPVYITEYDIPETSDATQLSVLQAQFPVFWNTASVHGITYWGWIAGQTWITGTGLVNGTSPRSAMTWLMGQLGRPVPPN
jgi:endo-1,4-beta-xylanase